MHSVVRRRPPTRGEGADEHHRQPEARDQEEGRATGEREVVSKWHPEEQEAAERGERGDRDHDGAAERRAAEEPQLDQRIGATRLVSQ
jgi:hypothetical protein